VPSRRHTHPRAEPFNVATKISPAVPGRAWRRRPLLLCRSWGTTSTAPAPCPGALSRVWSASTRGGITGRCPAGSDYRAVRRMTRSLMPAGPVPSCLQRGPDGGDSCHGPPTLSRRGLRLASQPSDTTSPQPSPSGPSTICQTLTNRIGGSARGSRLKYQQLSTVRNRRSASRGTGESRHVLGSVLAAVCVRCGCGTVCVRRRRSGAVLRLPGRAGRCCPGRCARYRAARRAWRAAGPG
jgi:hypothetical protein